MDSLLDSSFVIDVLRSRKAAVALAEKLASDQASLGIPALVLHEVKTGLLHSAGRAQAARFGEIFERFPILAFDAEAAGRSSEIQAEALRSGGAYGEIDAMIAGTALANDSELVTSDPAFDEIAEGFGLRLRKY